MVLRRPAEQAEVCEPGEHPVHVTKAELLTSARTGNASVKLSVKHLETGKPIELTPLLVGGGNENLATDNLLRLEQLAATAGIELRSHEDAEGNVAFDTSELIESLVDRRAWVQLGVRYDEFRQRPVNMLIEVLEPVSEDELAELAANRTSFSS
jgi:hypothetical protein